MLLRLEYTEPVCSSERWEDFRFGVGFVLLDRVDLGLEALRRRVCFRRGVSDASWSAVDVRARPGLSCAANDLLDESREDTFLGTMNP